MKTQFFSKLIIAVLLFAGSLSAQNFGMTFSGGKLTSNQPIVELNGASEFTIECRVFINEQSSPGIIFGKSSGDSRHRISLQVNNGKVYCVVANGANSYRYTTTAIIPTETWTHIAMVFDNTKTGANRIKLYINGAYKWAKAIGTFPNVTHTDNKLSSMGSVNLRSTIDEFRIWNKALTFGEISSWKEISLDNTHPSINNLVLYWNFDDVKTPVSPCLHTKYSATLNGNVEYTELVAFEPEDNFVLKLPQGGEVVADSVYATGHEEGLTLEAKIKLEEPVAKTDILSYGTDGRNQINLSLEKEKVVFGYNDSIKSLKFESEDLIRSNKWHHISLVFDNETDDAKLFVDGLEYPVTKIKRVIYDSPLGWSDKDWEKDAKPFWVAGSKFFKGVIDDVRVWSTALQQEDIARYVSKHVYFNHPEIDNLILNWTFNAVEGNVVPGSTNTAYKGNIEGEFQVAHINNLYTEVDPITIAYLPNYKVGTLTEAQFKHLHRIVYFSVEPAPDGTLIYSEADINHINTIKSLRGSKPVEIFLGAGGWVRSRNFPEMAADPVSRGKFVTELVAFCLEHELDGIDIDWEPYGGPVNINHYKALMQELRQETLPVNLGLSSAIGVSHGNNAAAVHLYIDNINIMAYGKPDGQGRHSSFELLTNSVDDCRGRGIPNYKLAGGIPFYGMTPGRQAKIYKQIVEIYPEIKPEDNWTPDYKYYFNGIDMVQKKANYAIDSLLYGVVIWELGQDIDVESEYSLLKALSEVIPTIEYNSVLKSSSIDSKNETEVFTTEINIYPNPVSDILNITLPSKLESGAEVIITNIEGSIMLHKRILKNESLNLNELSSGIYLVKILADDHLLTRKIIKN